MHVQHIVYTCHVGYKDVIFRNHISYQVPRSLPDQSRLLPLLFCFTSVQERIIFLVLLVVILKTVIVIKTMMMMMIYP